MSSTQLPKVLHSSVLIRFQDCDPYGHLNNSKYLDYYMNAREDQIRLSYDLNLYDIAKTRQIGWVVAQSQISYITPAQIMEKVQISTQLILYTPKSLLVEFRMMDEHRTQIKSMMWSKFVHVDLKTQKSKVHSDDLMQLFEQACAPIDQSEFNERLVFMASAVKSNG